MAKSCVTENDNCSLSTTGNKKAQNDPWVPLECASHKNQPESDTDKDGVTLDLQSLPQNPLYQMIDSEKYIQSLETKLAKLSSKRIAGTKEPTSRDIITNLALFREDQMQRYINDDSATASGSTNDSDKVVGEHSAVQSSFLQRRLYPDKQPITAEEIAELVKQDVLAAKFEELDTSPSLCSSRLAGDSGRTVRPSSCTATNVWERDGNIEAYNNTEKINDSTQKSQLVTETVLSTDVVTSTTDDKRDKIDNDDNWADFSKMVDSN